MMRSFSTFYLTFTQRRIHQRAQNNRCATTMRNQINVFVMNDIQNSTKPENTRHLAICRCTYPNFCSTKKTLVHQSIPIKINHLIIRRINIHISFGFIVIFQAKQIIIINSMHKNDDTFLIFNSFFDIF